MFVIQEYETKAAHGNEKFFYDRVIEVDLNSMEILWSWDTKTLKASETDLNPPQKFRNEMMHTNSVRYVPSNPINQKPAILVSMRNISTVALIDYETKEILWKAGEDIFNFQHDASILENGNLLVFNNRRNQTASSIEQINMLNYERVWQYKSATEQDFHSAVLGSVQRLANGNTLITEGPRGHVFEINSQKDVVWEYFSTFEIAGRESAWPLAPLFRVEQYSPEYVKKIGWGDICE
jgi:hypothetical protein